MSRSAERRLRQRRRKVAAATGTMLLVAAAVAGEPLSASALPLAGAVGGGLNGLVDPNSVGASGELGDDDRIGDEILDNADDIDKLLKLGPGAGLPNGPLEIPSNMYDAYLRAESTLRITTPNCHLPWSLLASIGRIESGHARGGRADAVGDTVPHILGPVLNGGGFAAIRDTDGGRYDGDNRWDRAVGAMQFIPSTWRGYAADGNADGDANPHNIYDATVAAGKYLCSGGLDMSNPQDRAAAVFRYNHSNSYVTTVLIWADAYAKGMTPMDPEPVSPDDSGPADLAQGPPSSPGVPVVPTPTPVPPPPPNQPQPQPPAPTPPPTPPTRTPAPCQPRPTPSPSPTETTTTTTPPPPTDPTTTDPTTTTTDPTPTTTTTPPC